MAGRVSGFRGATALLRAGLVLLWLRALHWAALLGTSTWQVLRCPPALRVTAEGQLLVSIDAVSSSIFGLVHVDSALLIVHSVFT